MSTFSYKLSVYSIDGTKTTDLEPLVDTGSTWTWLPATLVQSLGYRPTGRRRMETAEGKLIDREVTSVMVSLNGERLATLVVFGQPGDKILLGAVTMEEFGLSPDPIHKKLVPVVGSV